MLLSWSTSGAGGSLAQRGQHALLPKRQQASAARIRCPFSQRIHQQRSAWSRASRGKMGDQEDVEGLGRILTRLALTEDDRLEQVIADYPAAPFPGRSSPPPLAAA